MDDLNIPIFKKTYELYKIFHSYQMGVPKQDRYTIWQRCENALLDVLEGILWASQLPKTERFLILEKTSVKLNFLRVFIRLCKEVKAIDSHKYITLQELIDEIGRMLGGWIKSARER